jgi:predicted negative regulator of RcsB-dependent stress response
MTYTRLNARGASHIVVIALVAILAVVGFAGYKVLGNNSKQSASTSSQNQAVTAPDKIKTKADLQQSAKSLDGADVDKSLDSTQLDTDLNDLL